ncbi:MAG TPA: hypothetical protein VJU01_06040, partial [Gaiellaceae bacterium]|nr:hypothetical protein [Gaiellaceae bacterium]
GWGIAILLRRRPELVAWGLIAFAGPPLLSTLVRTGRAPDLSPRHLIFALPFFAAFVGVAVARIPGRPLPLAGLAVVAVLSTQGINDPRSITYTAALGSRTAVAEPGAWLRANVQPNDVLYPYSSVYLAALPDAGEARGLPRAQVQSLLAALDRVDYPSGDVYVAVPVGTSRRFERPPPLFGGQDFGSWVILRRRGPFADREEVLRAIELGLAQGRSQLRTPLPVPLIGWFELNRAVVCETLAKLGSQCGTE